MKLIAMMPVKNEAKILPTTLTVLNSICDHIFIADDFSEDDTIGIAKNFSKVSVIPHNAYIPNGPCGEKLRPTLFETARDFSGNNLLLFIDADELLPPKLWQGVQDVMEAEFLPGTQFSLPWVQLWKGLNQYQAGNSIWSNLNKIMLLYDDRRPVTWSPRTLHSGRLPDPVFGKWQNITLSNHPVLHLEWVYWNKTQIKQARYRVLEFIEQNFTSAYGINIKYSITFDNPNAILNDVPEQWLNGINFPENIQDISTTWELTSIMEFFQFYGIKKFEPLQIWHIPELHRLFIETTKRSPRGHSLAKKLTRRVADKLKRDFLYE